MVPGPTWNMEIDKFPRVLYVKGSDSVCQSKHFNGENCLKVAPTIAGGSERLRVLLMKTCRRSAGWPFEGCGYPELYCAIC